MGNEAVTVAPVKTDEPAAKLATLSNVEKVVNIYAKSYCKKFSINPDHFSVFLCSELGGIMKVRGGHVVEIYLQWPQAQPSINTLLGDAFRLIKKYNVRRALEIVPVAYVRTQRNEIKKRWRKEQFTDESEIVLDLIPKHRLRVHKTETTIIEDVVTGEKLTYIHEYPTDRFDAWTTGLWFDLSRIVRARHPEVEEVEVEASVTPILDETLASDEFAEFVGEADENVVEEETDDRRAD